MIDNLNPVGRKSRKGIPNKTTKSIKDMIEGALKAKGGQKWIERQMDENPTAAMALIGKILPKQIDVKAEHTGDMQITTIQRTIVRPDK